jgi:alpha-beta hydrolase superfamily lysophospholipase
MATYAFIHGAADVGWSWSLVADELRSRGHDAVAPDLPCEDESAGWSEYADTVVDAIGDRDGEVVVVAHSLGGFTAPIVCTRGPVDLLVLVAGMVPLPGETGGEWWTASGYEEAARERAEREGGGPGDAIATFLHDVPADLAAGALRRSRDQAERPMLDPWPLDAWPEVPTRFVLCADDRFFPPEFMRRMVRERLGITPDEIATGHAPYLARPRELADRLEAYRAEVAEP